MSNHQSICSSEETCSACVPPVDLRFFGLESKVDARGIGVGYGCLDGSQPLNFLNFIIKAFTSFVYTPAEDDCTIENSQTRANWNGSQEIVVSQFGDLVVVGGDSWSDSGSNANAVPCQEFYYEYEGGPFPGECPHPCAPYGTPGAWNHPVPPLDYKANYDYKYSSKTTFRCSAKTQQNPYSQIVIDNKWNSTATNTVSSNRGNSSSTTVPGNQDIGGIVPGTLNLGGNSGCTNSDYNYSDDGGYSANSSVILTNPVTTQYLAGKAKQAMEIKWGIKNSNQANNCNGDKCTLPYLTDRNDLSTLQQYTGEDACWFQLAWNNYQVPNVAAYPTVPSKAKFRVTAPKAQFDAWAIANTINSITGKVYIYTAPYGDNPPCCGGIENFNGRILSEENFTIAVDGDVMWEAMPHSRMYYSELGIEITGEGGQSSFAGETVGFCVAITSTT